MVVIIKVHKLRLFNNKRINYWQSIPYQLLFYSDISCLSWNIETLFCFDKKRNLENQKSSENLSGINLFLCVGKINGWNCITLIVNTKN